LQYVDDLLIGTGTEELCIAWTISLLNFLGLNGYRASPQKAQVAKQQVVYLGYGIAVGLRALETARKEATCQTPEPWTAKELHTFLGMTGWCQLWIHNYGLLVKPLFALLKTNPSVLTWDGEIRRSFKLLKYELM